MKQILYIEDDPHFNSYFSEKLKFNLSDNAINLHSVTNLADFYESTKSSNKYDIVILDYDLNNWSNSNQIPDIVKEISRHSKVVIYSSQVTHNISPYSENKNVLLLKKDLNIFENFQKLLGELAPQKQETVANQNLLLVKNDIRIINNNLIDFISKNPNIIYDLQPRQFEELVAELFFKEGYEVQLTPNTNDGGKDIYAMKRDAFNQFLFAIECKKYSPENKIGRPIIQKLNGVVEAERLTGGILVTTSFFTKQAVEFSKQLSNRIFLNDYYNLMEIIKKHGKT